MTLPNTPDPAARGTQPSLKRIPAQYRFRPLAFYDRRAGELCGTFSQGMRVSCTPRQLASHVLTWVASPALGAVAPRTVYLTGGEFADDRPARDWWREPLQHGWQIASWRTDPWRVEYRRGETTIEIAVAAPWFGSEHDARLCYVAYIALRAELQRRFRDTHAELLTTPASTGADLLRRSLPLRLVPPSPENGYARENRMRAVEYPPIPDALCEILTTTQGQGRMECVAPPDRETAPEFCVYDARFQYAACVAHLPIGPWQHDTDVPDLVPYRAGWYRVDAWVPDDWEQLGLIPIRDAAAGLDAAGRPRRVWPRTPGTAIRDAWVSGPELHVAVNVAGWRVAIKERWLAAPQASGPGDPGRRWMEHLRELRTDMQAEDDGREWRALVANAARHLLIDPIGYLWRPERRVAGIAATLADLPDVAGIGDVLATEDGIEYTVPAPFGAMRAALYRPEIAATVWGRSLARTNARALMVPPRDLLWVRFDGVVTAAPQPWIDQNRIGDWRLKARLETALPDVAELPIPRDETTYRAMWARAGTHGPAYRLIGERPADDVEMEGNAIA